MTGATSPRLQLELLCARLLLPAADDAERGIRARVDRIERRLEMTSPRGAGGPRPSRPRRPGRRQLGLGRAGPVPLREGGGGAGVLGRSPAPTGPESPAPGRTVPGDRAGGSATPPAAPAAATPASCHRTGRRRTRCPAAARPRSAEVGPGAGGTEAVRRMWPDVMSRLGGLKRTTWSLVSHYAQVLDYDGKRLLLQFDSPGRAASFGKGAHQEFLRQALIDVMGIDCKFEATAGGAPSPVPSGQQGPPAAPAAPTQWDPAGAARSESQLHEPPGPVPGPAGAARSAGPARGSRACGLGARPLGAAPGRTAHRRHPAPAGAAAGRRPARGPRRVAAPSGPCRSKRDRPVSARASAAAPSASAPSAPATSPAVAARPAPAVTSVVLPAGPTVRPADDVPSHDDPDLEGSNLVGASVVEQTARRTRDRGTARLAATRDGRNGMERVSIYEAAGGEPAFAALAAAHHARCLADPVLEHPFSHGVNPDHVERLAAYWAEVLGGPPTYSARYGGHSEVMRMHAGHGMEADLGERFVACFVAAADDAGLPDEPELRAALRAYMEWADELDVRVQRSGRPRAGRNGHAPVGMGRPRAEPAFSTSVRN